jgi:hypothetical protein
MYPAPERRAISQAIVAVAILLCSATQGAESQAILENDQMRLELIGLKQWTVPMIQDSLRRYAPKDSLLSHACAGVLREKLRFADASVVYYTTTIAGKAMKPYLAVTVVEPQDSALIRYRGPFRDSLPARRGWSSIRAVFEKHNEAFQGAVQRLEFLRSDAALSGADSALAPALPLRRFLRTHSTAKDQQLALATLATNGNAQDRVAATVLLANFSGSDSSWWALTEALRDPDAQVRATAAQVLAGLTRSAPRRVNWAPATQSLRAILDGTNLFAHNEIMEALAATDIDPTLARPLLKDGGFLVLAKLGSQGLAERQASRRFLLQLAGRDLGDAPAAWREWLDGL